MALYIDVGLEDVLRIGETFVVLERKSGSRARLKIIGKAEVELMKKERIKVRIGDNPVSQTTGD